MERLKRFLIDVTNCRQLQLLILFSAFSLLLVMHRGPGNFFDIIYPTAGHQDCSAAVNVYMS